LFSCVSLQTLVGLHSNSCSIPEASWPAVNISSAGTWFQARREVCTLREDPRRGGRGDENIRQVSICRHGAAARRESFNETITKWGLQAFMLAGHGSSSW
jgi:hypothetical protein